MPPLLKSICAGIAFLMFSVLLIHVTLGQDSDDRGFRRLFDVFGRSEPEVERPEPLISSVQSVEEQSANREPFLSRFNVPWRSQPTTDQIMSTDPFSEYGIEAQRSLAEHLAPRDPNRLPNDPYADSAPPRAASSLIGRPYPWPVPIDSAVEHGDGKEAQSLIEGVASSANRAIEQSSDAATNMMGRLRSSANLVQQKLGEIPSSTEVVDMIDDAVDSSLVNTRQTLSAAVSAVVADETKPDEASDDSNSSPPQLSIGLPAENPATIETIESPLSRLVAPTKDTGPIAAGGIVSATKQPADFGQLDENTKILAVVGDQLILAGDVYSQIAPMLARHKGQVPEEQLKTQRDQLVKQLLPNLVENKLIYLDFLRTIPRDKLPEIERRVYDEFVKSEVPKIMKQAEVKTPTELDAKLRKMGSSLDKQRRFYMERELSGLMVSQNIKRGREITHQQLLDDYHENAQDYEYNARARWEKLTAKRGNYAKREDANRAVAEMGNEVLGGAPFSAVAKRSSEGARAQQGGLYDWTTKGSLVSEPIDETIFTIPIGKMSRVLEDENGFHIVRVIERHDAGKIAFTEVQQKISEKIRKNWLQKDVKKYIQSLREGSHVWTVDDEQQQPTGRTESPPNRAAPGQGRF
jgi:parvulin-like peptidyl-prolyl isomerase